MREALNKMIETIYTVCDAIDESITKKHLSEGASLKQVFVEECIHFFMYLSASDGAIKKEEAQFINDLFKTAYSTNDINSIIQRENLYSAAFESTVPLTMKCFVAQDNKKQAGEKKTASSSEQLFYAFEKMGKEFLACDDNMSDSEVDDLTIYLTMLKDYILSEGKFTTRLYGKISIRKEDGEENEETLQDLLNELDSLTGLKAVKNDVNSLINLLQIQQIREERGLKTSPISLHLVFTGNPGTGKTTVARLLAKIYNKLGVLSKGQLVEVDRSGLIAGYVGQTALKVQEVIEKAMGGVLFIDEAYSLTANTSGQDYGHEAVETLLKSMEDNRGNLVVIVAGYPDLMSQFLASNPGLRSRFNKFIHFEDYKPEELFDIFCIQCEKGGYTVDENGKNYISKAFERKYAARDKMFANGRDVRNFFERAVVNQANRLMQEIDLSNEQLLCLTYDDVASISL